MFVLVIWPTTPFAKLDRLLPWWVSATQMTEYVRAGRVAPEPEAASVGVGVVPSAKVSLPPKSIASSWRRKVRYKPSVARAFASSYPSAAYCASKVTESSRPRPT